MPSSRGKTVAAAASPAGLPEAVACGARWIALSSGEPCDGRALARRHGVFLLTVDEPAHADRASTHPAAAVLWSPDGGALARQRSVLDGAAELDLIEVDGWPCGILVGQDARSPELARVLQLRGALCLWCLPDRGADGGAWGQTAGVWSLVQQTQCFAIEAAAPPWRQALHAPCELTPDRTGFLARGEALAVATLDAAALDELRGAYDLRRHLNPAFYRRYMPRIYEGPA